MTTRHSSHDQDLDAALRAQARTEESDLTWAHESALNATVGPGTEPEVEPPGRTLGQQVKSGLGWSFVSSIGSRGLTLMSGIVLARILTPKDFGVFAIALVALNLVTSLNDVGLAATLIRWPGEVDDVAPTATTLVFGLSGLVYVAFYLGAPWFCREVHTPEAIGVLRLLVLTVVINGVDAVPGALLTRSFRQDRRTVADLVGSVLSIGLSIALALVGEGAWSLAWGRLFGNMVNSTLVIWFSPKRYWPRFDRDAARRLLAYGVPLAGSTMLSVAVLNVDYVVVGRTLGTIALGFYLLAFNISSWPINFFSVAIQQVSIAGFAKLQDDRAKLHSGFIRSMTLLAVITVPICVLMSALSLSLVEVVYGTKWTVAADALRFLALLAFVRVAQNLAFDALIAVGKARATVWLQGGWLVILIPTLLAGAHIDGIRGVAIGQILVGVSVVIPLYLIALSQIGIGLRELGRQLVWPAIGGAAATMVGGLIAHSISGDLVELAVGGIAGLAVYCAFLLPMRRTLFLTKIPAAVSGSQVA